MSNIIEEFKYLLEGLVKVILPTVGYYGFMGLIIYKTLENFLGM